VRIRFIDCLLKGPPAPADLYTVILGIRENKVAFTKDISKFYQCVEADAAAQHIRRILWRFGNVDVDPNYICHYKRLTMVTDPQAA
jgi:hypothetical protein